MKKQLKKGIALIMAMLLLLTAAGSVESAQAASKTIYYYTSDSRTVPVSKGQPGAKKVVLQKSKLTIYGSLQKAATENKLYSNGKYCKSKKRVFKLAKNVTFWVVDDFKDRLSFSEAKKQFKGFVCVRLKIVGGKVTKVVFHA